MENVNQDAMMHSSSPTSHPGADGPLQIPDERDMLDETNDGDPTGTDKGDSGAASGSPNMEPDTDTDGGTGESIGNNDGTELGPEVTDEEFLK